MAKNDMKKNVGLTSPRNKSDVTGNDYGLASSGMLGKGVNRADNRFAGNYSGLTMREDYGMGPRKGNASSSATHDTAHPATFDKLQKTVSTAAGKKPVEGPFEHLHFANPDKINVGNN
jgi:hypothetical protein